MAAIKDTAANPERVSQTTSEKGVKMIKGVDPDDIDTRCGYGGCKNSEDLQNCCNTSKGLGAAIYAFHVVYGMLQMGFINVMLAPLQRRYQFSSVQVSLIPLALDIFGGITAIIFGYLGTFYHKGRILTVAAIGQCFGSFMFLLVHIISDKYELGVGDVSICIPDEDLECLPDGSGSGLYYAMFMVGQVGHGICGGIIFAVVVPYIDENTKAKNTPVYIGLLYAFTAVGAMLGYLIGGICLTIHVDIGRIDMEDVTITPQDPTWVGAWWIPFIISSTGAGLMAIYLGMFPQQIPAAARYAAERTSQAYGGGGEVDLQKGALRKLWDSTKLLLRNPTFDLLILAGIIEMGHLMGFIVFFPMIITFQFDQNPAIGALIAGVVIVPAAILGQIFGGLIPKWLNSKVRGLIAQTTICSLIVALLSPSLLLRCPTPEIAGINRAVFNSSIIMDDVNLVDACNYDCGCDTRAYEPICGADNVQYFSPCHGACLNQTVNDGDDVFYDCGCILGEGASEFDAVSGTCDSDCYYFYIFLGIFFVAVFFIFVAFTAGLTSTVRCVPETERSYAVGLQSTIVRFLGSGPFPILFGLIFDSSCLLWQETCDVRGACWIYDTRFLAIGLAVITVVCKGLGCLLTFLAMMCYKPPPEEISVEDKKCIVSEDVFDATLDDGIQKQYVNAGLEQGCSTKL